MCANQYEIMKQSLMSCVQSQMSNLKDVDAKELGEAIDMLKDLEEAMYYCTITKAMEEKNKESEYYYYIDSIKYEKERDVDREKGRMYYTSPNYQSPASTIIRSSDPKEGRSHQTRKTYMESKEMHRDKASQLKELEKYMQELTQDMVEMIEDASPEEKQYLEKRVSALASKIAQVK